MKSKFLGLLAIVIAVSASAFTTTKTQAVKRTAALNWYKVTYDAMHPTGAILSSSDFLVNSEKSQVESPCEEGTERDCLRGFSSTITAFPNTASGTDQIQKPNE